MKIASQFKKGQYAPPVDLSSLIDCFRTDELNHTVLRTVTAAGQFICHQSHYQGAKVKIMGSLQFKNSFYCSFSRNKQL